MGANAQITVPTFVASQVLTADQQNQSARTGVPVFATTVTRDAAFGGTGEKTLAEGQLCYVEGTGLQTYNGSTWVTWGTAPSAGALTLISSTTIGSAVSSVTVSNAFSATYDAYKITITGGTMSADALGNTLALGATTTGYYWSASRPVWAGTYSGDGASNASAWTVDIGAANTQQVSIEVFNPYAAKNTSFWSASVDMRTGLGRSFYAGGYLDNTTSYTAFTYGIASGTMTGGIIRVYGYANS